MLLGFERREILLTERPPHVKTQAHESIAGADHQQQAQQVRDVDEMAARLDYQSHARSLGAPRGR